MRYLAFGARVAAQLRDELLAATPLESGVFCLLEAIRADGAERFVVGRPVTSAAPWVEQGSRRLAPSGRAISQAVSAATDAGCGLAFVHTHPADKRRPELSLIDEQTSIRLAVDFADLLDGQFASLVLGPGGFGGALASGGRLARFDRIAVTGRTLEVSERQLAPIDGALDDRQERALGDAGHRRLRDLRIVVVGAGGLGSPVAETLVRMGAGWVGLMDYDYLDTPSNARRVFGVGLDDAKQHPPVHKAEAVAAGLRRLRLGGEIEAIHGDIRDEAVRSVLLSADVVLNGTDTHSSRAFLTELVVRAAVPAIDVGVRIGARRDGSLDALLFERRVLLPDGPCLWCWERLNADRVRAEMLPKAERQALAEEGYVTGDAGAPAPSVAALTVTAAGAAVSALLGMLTGAFDVAPLGMSVDALSLESRAFGRSDPDPACICATWRTNRVEV